MKKELKDIVNCHLAYEQEVTKVLVAKQIRNDAELKLQAAKDAVLKVVKKPGKFVSGNVVITVYDKNVSIDTAEVV